MVVANFSPGIKKRDTRKLLAEMANDFQEILMGSPENWPNMSIILPI